MLTLIMAVVVGTHMESIIVDTEVCLQFRPLHPELLQQPVRNS